MNWVDVGAYRVVAMTTAVAVAGAITAVPGFLLLASSLVLTHVAVAVAVAVVFVVVVITRSSLGAPPAITFAATTVAAVIVRLSPAVLSVPVLVVIVVVCLRL